MAKPLTPAARTLLAACATDTYEGNHMWGPNCSDPKAYASDSAALESLEAARLVTTLDVSAGSEDAEDPYFRLTITARGRKSYERAKSAGLI